MCMYAVICVEYIESLNSFLRSRLLLTSILSLAGKLYFFVLFIVKYVTLNWENYKYINKLPVLITFFPKYLLKNSQKKVSFFRD